ncbi:uncharacterized protein LOC143027209 [Oratosquilla oratoria]|uniref:uncharacterized protein LOC143027209 n=1 Tax=Oratosquilla oratoria TaxID=337810 RepID=UPI003F763BEE
MHVRQSQAVLSRSMSSGNQNYLNTFVFFFCIVFSAKDVAAYDPEASITGLYTGPYFDPLAPRNLTAHLGDQAVLPCTVRQLGDKSVSWVRMRDADILTVDRYTFVGDERFEAHYSTSHETWNLVIKYVQERDAGQYECQVSTEPKMSQLFNLRVVVPKVEIDPPRDQYVEAGSTVKINCKITDVVQLPDYIFWYHEKRRIMDHNNYMVTVKRTGAEAITSTLVIHRVSHQEMGNYTCMPSNLHASSIVLHVPNEQRSAIKDGRNAGSTSSDINTKLVFLMILLVMATMIPPSSTTSVITSREASGSIQDTYENRSDIRALLLLQAKILSIKTSVASAVPFVKNVSLLQCCAAHNCFNPEHMRVFLPIWESDIDSLLGGQKKNIKNDPKEYLNSPATTFKISFAVVQTHSHGELQEYGNKLSQVIKCSKQGGRFCLPFCKILAMENALNVVTVNDDTDTSQSQEEDDVARRHPCSFTPETLGTISGVTSRTSGNNYLNIDCCSLDSGLVLVKNIGTERSVPQASRIDDTSTLSSVYRKVCVKRRAPS